MNDESARRWARVDELFAAAMTQDASDRRAFLLSACAGDQALEREVGELLDSLTQAESAIGESAGALLSGPLVEAPDAALPQGARIGAYEVRRLLGRGGMGNVYVAVRADGDVAREVAIKVVRAGFSGDILARRLRHERRILAELEHPRIARLYDSGVTPDGAPFLVMELVHGTRIDRYVESAGLTVRERLLLFDEVCEAVAFAHQRLVVHRDLKPANVLVSDGGHAMLLDFGIARLVAGSSEHDEQATRPGHLVFTPEYASPEQTRGEPAGVAMDVYALGVLLYELLTGERPAWQRLVMTRADDAAIEVAMVAPSRVAKDPTRARAMRGDLDRVVLKALAPLRAQRYATVQELREDLRRVREGFPILARKASRVERAVRMGRRNPALAATGAALAIVTLAFVVNTAVQGRRLAAERDVANRQRDRARATSQVLATLFERADPFAPGRGDTLRVTQVLAEGLERVNRGLADQPGARAELLSALGRAYVGLGRYAEAQALLDTARALQEDDPDATAEDRAATLSALGNLARLRGRFDAADSLHGGALAIRAERSSAADRLPGAAALATSPPSSTAPERAASMPRTEPDVAELAVALANVGGGHMARSRFDSARIYLDSALTVLRTIPAPDSGKLADLLNNRATLAMRTSDFVLANRLAQEAYDINVVRLGPDHPRVAAELANLGFLLDRTGRSAEAEPKLREALRILSERLSSDHPSVRSAKLTLGGILGRMGRLEEAERMIGEVVAAERAIGDDARLPLTISLDNHAGVLEKLGRVREAQGEYREAFELRRAASGDADPGTAILLSRVADIDCRLDGATPAGLADFERALGTLDRLLPPVHPAPLGGRAQYGSCLVRAGRRLEGERELLAAFERARSAPPQAHGVARTAGRELLAMYSAAPDSVRRAGIQARLDSLDARATPR